MRKIHCAQGWFAAILLGRTFSFPLNYEFNWIIFLGNKISNIISMVHWMEHWKGVENNKQWVKNEKFHTLQFSGIDTVAINWRGCGVRTKCKQIFFSQNNRPKVNSHNDKQTPQEANQIHSNYDDAAGKSRIKLNILDKNEWFRALIFHLFCH